MSCGTRPRCDCSTPVSIPVSSGSGAGMNTSGYGVACSTGAQAAIKCRPGRGQKGGCAQCAHLGGRTGPYRCRSGPVWGGFRGEASVCKGVKPVQVPLRAQCFPLSEAVSLSDCAQTGAKCAQGVPVSVGGLQSSCDGPPPFYLGALWWAFLLLHGGVVVKIHDFCETFPKPVPWGSLLGEAATQGSRSRRPSWAPMVRSALSAWVSWPR
ncbi:hypothetical protein H4V95_002335 [Arthrobacter sp. CAN_C5]|nr:hypothetical protein [Arthrobacter sp. CAN_C5]